MNYPSMHNTVEPLKKGHVGMQYKFSYKFCPYKKIKKKIARYRESKFWDRPQVMSVVYCT